MTDYLTVIEVLSIHGGYVMADADETHAFIMGLHEMDDFCFERLAEMA